MYLTLKLQSEPHHDFNEHEARATARIYCRVRHLIAHEPLVAAVQYDANEYRCGASDRDGDHLHVAAAVRLQVVLDLCSRRGNSRMPIKVPSAAASRAQHQGLSACQKVTWPTSESSPG